MKIPNPANGKQIFDGGAVGRDLVQVFSPGDGFTGDCYPFMLEDASTGLDSGAGEAPMPSSRPAPVPEVAAPRQPEPPPQAPPPPQAAPPPPEPTGPDLAQIQAELQAAEERGFTKGLAKAAAEHAEAERRLSEQFEGAVAYLHEAIERAEAKAAHQAMQLALVVAEELFGRAVSADPEALLGAVQSFCDNTEGHEPLKIVCDQETAKAWRAQSAGLEQLLDGRGFEIEGSDSLHTGDVMVYSGPHTMDQRLKTRIEQYKNALEQELGVSLSGAPA